MQILLIVALLAVTVSSFRPNLGSLHDPELNDHWVSFKNQHRRSYSQDEEIIRRTIWESNLRKIQQHNLEHDMGQHTFTLGMNQFGDLTHAEFRAQYLSRFNRSQDRAPGSLYMPVHLGSGQLPDTVDWRTQGYVTPIKDQQQCGSCWAFSTTGSLEGQYFRKQGILESFSEQQLVDCSRAQGNQGCNGGLMDYGFDYIKQYGIERETDYPYTARDGICRYSASLVVTKVTGYVDIPSQNEVSQQNAVATQGPVSVAIDASNFSFQFYKNGVYNEPACSPVYLDHGVLAVGYGTENGKDYWLVKNSWGLSWGDQGYIKMSRNLNNQCGIATASSYPLL